jgi:hypothetical protein
LEIFVIYIVPNNSRCSKTSTDSYTKNDVDVKWDDPGPFLLDRNEANYDVKLDMMESEDLLEAEGLVDDHYSCVNGQPV